MIAEIETEIPKELLENTPNPETIAPSFKELDELAKVDGIDKRVIVVRDSGSIEACGVFNIEKRRHHGINLKVYALFGYLLHDYCRIFSKSTTALNLLIKAAQEDARTSGCDIIIWTNIPAELVPEGCLPVKEDIKIFDALKDDVGWSSFYKKKNVKYLLNKVKKMPSEYKVEIIDGYINDELMEEFAKLHILRWRFADSKSPFLFNKKRKIEYRIFPKNKHYLRILTGDEIIGCHYGMRYGDTLLFHTPIINPKYLDLSPMKLILAETAKYCEQNGINSIDFGHGDEAYKDGYCTLPRYTCSYEHALTVKGRISTITRGLAHIGFPKNLIVRKSTTSILNRRNSFSYKIEVNSNLPTTGETKIISNWTDFCDFCKLYELPIYKYQYLRFHNDKKAAVAANIVDGVLKSSLWVSSENCASNTDDDSEQSRLIYDIHFDDIESLKSLLIALSDSLNCKIKATTSRVIKGEIAKIFDVE